MWEGKKQNKFVYDGKILEPKQTMSLILESHAAYQAFCEDKELNYERKYWTPLYKF